MIEIGLTGTLGAGKSTVGRMLEALGALRIDTDRLARDVVEPGSPALREIVDAWGESLLREDGTLDRDALRRIILESPQSRARLEAITHPAIVRRLNEELDEGRAAGFGVAVVEIPLLFETDLDDLFDLVVAVDAPPDERLRRVREERGISEEEFRALDAAQLTGAEKSGRADFVIHNDGSPDELRAETERLWNRIASDRDLPAESGRRWVVDLHMHTNHSHDCLSDAAAVVARARAVGLDKIAVTDHNEIEGAHRAHELDPDLVIVGEEVLTAEGLDLIGLFLSQHIPRGGAFADVADAIHAQGGVTYLPHPFDRWRGAEESVLDGLIEHIDVVEAFNARVHDATRNTKALEWARKHSLPIGAGSDAHTLGEIGAGTVALEPFDGPAEFVRAAADGIVAGSSSPQWVHFGSTWAKLRKRLPF